MPKPLAGPQLQAHKVQTSQPVGGHQLRATAMRNPIVPDTRDLVLIGGGHTHALVLRKWGMNPLEGARVTVINPQGTAPYSGMLPGHLAGHYTRDALDIDLVKLSRFASARLVRDRAVGLDLAKREVLVASGRRIAFDVASLDIGITSAMPDLPGFDAHAVPAKPLGPLADAWRAVLAREAPVSVAVIGGGVAGAEILAAFAHQLNTRGHAKGLHLIERGTALAGLHPPTAQRLRHRLAELGATIHENARICAITGNSVQLEDREIAASFVCGAAGARPQEWLQDTGLDLHEGFVKVSATLETSAEGVFATGDCAHMVATPRPKAGVFAVRQAPVLFENLRACLSGHPPNRNYRPQDDYLKLISLGDKEAVGNRFGLAFQGPSIWRLKDRIDRGFMRKFQDLPVMAPQVVPKHHAAGVSEALSGQALCGGCGAKVGQGALLAALSGTSTDPNTGDDAALLKIGGADIVLTTDHLREVVSDPHVMAQIAAHHALGDIWAMGARAEAVTANIVLPQMSARLAERSLTEILDAAAAVFTPVGARIVGGHSSLGAELTIGFTLLGPCPSAPITLAGAQIGDRLVLTKPIGSGVLLAAEMAGRARAAWVEAAITHMTTSQQTAATLLSGAHAMTDVTGFGLVGHLQNICRASGVGARVQAAAVPLMSGALTLAEEGIRSSLFDENRAVLPELPKGARNDLLFDPQTSGGLLAAVAPDSDALPRLIDAGFPAADIGEVTPTPGIQVV